MTDHLTTDSEAPDDRAENAPPSSSTPMLNFDPAQLVAMRVRPAQFARLCQVSRQSVSDWIKRGVISLGPDGLLDPVTASRQVFERTDPARLRARVFRDIARDIPELREQVRELRQALKEARAERDQIAAEREALAAALDEAMRLRLHPDDIAARLHDLLTGIADQWPALASSAEAGDLPEDLERLACRLFHRFTDADMTEAFGDDEGPGDLDSLADLADLDRPGDLDSLADLEQIAFAADLPDETDQATDTAAPLA